MTLLRWHDTSTMKWNFELNLLNKIQKIKIFKFKKNYKNILKNCRKYDKFLL